MTRAQQQISIAVLLSSIYAALCLNYIPLPQKIQTDILPVLPFWLLISFGCVLLGKLGYGVATFNNVPEAHAELMSEIEIAKSELRLKGVEVDD